jgi:lipid-A-disaccharide synthase-like uncharacterized protein
MTLDPRSWDIWVGFGLLGQAIFGSRFLVQWIASERRKVSHIPVVFWYLSMIGGLITLAYAIHKHDPVFIISQAGGLIVYGRNLMLINRDGHHADTATAHDTPQDRP